MINTKKQLARCVYIALAGVFALSGCNVEFTGKATVFQSDHRDGQPGAMTETNYDCQLRLAVQVAELKVECNGLRGTVQSLESKLAESGAAVRKNESRTDDAATARPTPPEPPQYTIESDGQGGGLLSFRVPGAPNVIHTTFFLPAGHSMYTTTVGLIPKIRIGEVSANGARWSGTPASAFSRCVRLRNGNPSAAELIVWIGDIRRAGTYQIQFTRSKWILNDWEYAPGITVPPTLHYDR